MREEVTGPERAQVLADFAEERDRLDEVAEALTGRRPPEPAGEGPEDDGETAADQATADDRDEQDGRAAGDEPDAGGRSEGSGDDGQSSGPALLQLSWDRGQVVAWVAGKHAPAQDTDEVTRLLTAAGSSPDHWHEREERLRLPTGERADALTAPIHDTLGWLVGLGSTTQEDGVGPSVTWLGLAAALAVRLVAQGRMLPQMHKVGDAPGNRSYFEVRWDPAVVDHRELQQLARSMPGTVSLLQRQRDPRAVTESVVAGFIDAICRDAASRVAVPAPPPQPTRPAEVAETVLARLDGSTFEAPHQQGSEVGRGLKQWANGLTGASKLRLIVRLEAPDEGDAWLLRTLVPGGRRKDEHVEAAMSRANHDRKELIKRELERLEELYEPLQRGKDRRRGQVVLSQEEAWQLMAERGAALTAAGFDVQVPPLKRRKATPSLRVTSLGGPDAKVGAQQLSDVQWSAVFDDVELSSSEIRRLAAESRPLVRSQEGRWVEVDHADLHAAAEALAEREREASRLSGADMLRFALGLDGQALGRTVSVAGDSWAAELLRSASEIPEDPPRSPEGFEGELRSYQAEAVAWLSFLDQAGLGGCLALDMGLGKTPVMLSHLHQTTERGPALVIAPPAVVGNWAAEARRFTPSLDVVVHHGQNRASTREIGEVVADADVVITTYGTAVRDIAALEEISWGKVVLDEAQVIKNPASDTAQQLRRLEAHTRVVLTGTPIENGLGDLWALMDFVNPGLVGDRPTFVAQMQKAAEQESGAESALHALNGVLVFRRTKAEPSIAEELPDRIDELDHCPMTAEQIGLYQAVLDELVAETAGDDDRKQRKGAVLAAITALKQICNHPAAYTGDDEPLVGRSGKLARLEEIVDNVFASGERMLIFTHFASWGERLAEHLTERTGVHVGCYHGGLSRSVRDRYVREFQEGEGPGALVLSLKAGGTGLNLTAASHVVLYDRWWNPAVEDQARDRVWRIGQTKTVLAHRLVCPGTVDERVEEVVEGKRRVADLALPKSSSVGDLDQEQLRRALGIDPDALLADDAGARERVAAGDVA